ncbi:hypothetical protein BEP19_09155 [Ammoniphilus oxalaticus]|uniref:Uncharacterized protein n=1 Tax=Ammoniphilus oxalaticus TaxID=66863 RepID=A0A419SKR6_9BACL|nr:hypothetical protein [Ammoniphilus oxalaticus]RKD24540.1 hypothetical protein BEP19_09155 [Ammoniphilus oxalaticus]
MKKNAFTHNGKVLFFQDETHTYMPKGWTKDAIISPDDTILKAPDYYVLLLLCSAEEEGISHKHMFEDLSKTDRKRKKGQLKRLTDSGMIQYDGVQNRYYAFFNTYLDEQQRDELLTNWSQLADEMLPTFLEEIGSL